MIKKISLLFVVASFVMTTSCKKEETPKHILGGNPSMQMEEVRVKPTPITDGKYPEMTFGREYHDFGTIEQGKKVVCIFQFKNTGKSDLTILGARGSCGCTVPEYSKTPIKPGAIGEIKVSFNSAGKIGEQHKTVTVFSNIKEETKILNIKSNVVSAETK